jgi:hypothetical protein
MITDLTRRYALTGGAALIAAPLLTWPRLALAAGVALAPDYTANWRVHKLSSKVKVEQISGGIRASTSTLLDDIKYQVALWSKERVSGDWTIKFGYKVISRLSASGGTFCCFYFNGVGEGSTRYPTNISSWTNIEPEDTVYFQHSRGLRFSFATANPNPKFPERLRLRRYNRSTGPFIGEQSPKEYPFTTGVPYLVAVTRKGTKLTVAVTNKSTNDTKSYSWTDATWIPKWRDGHIGFRWRGQVAEVTDLTVSPA